MVMKAIKTYGINGLLEWHGTINSHGVKMKLDFTNGSVTAFGVAPATFTTKDELTQYIIEGSDQFQKGRIRLIATYPMEAPKAEVKAEEPKPEAEEQPLKEVKVSSLDDAKEYLIENFGMASSKLRSRVQIVNGAKINGVKFIWED